jgi:hypothetical protein
MATRNLVPLKLNVGIDPITGYALYPNFNLVSDSTRKGMDWSKYLDVHGGGMHYDKTSGHKEDSVESPFGQQICCMCVPQDFATEALSLFPDKVSAITPAEFETFHDVKAHAHEPDEKIDSEVLNGLNIQRSLKIAVSQDTAAIDIKISKALDPDDLTEPGVSKNTRKNWATAKKEQGITLKDNA